MEGLAAAFVPKLSGRVLGTEGSRRVVRARWAAVESDLMILAGDIGGTSTRLAFFELGGKRLRVVAEQTYVSNAHHELEEIVAQFTSAHKLSVDCACFGIAGPIKQGRGET